MQVSRIPLLAILAVLTVVALLPSSHGAAPVSERADAARLREEVAVPANGRLRVDAIRESATSTRLRLDPSRLAVTPLPNAARVIATDLAGKEIPLQHSSDGMVSVDSKPGQWVVVKPVETTTAPMTGDLQWLPGVCIPPADAGTSAEASTLRSYAKFGLVPVVWDTVKDAYRAVASIGVARNGDPTATGSLGAQAQVKLAFEGVSAEPREFSIDTVGFGGERTVEFTFTRTLSKDPRMIVRTNVAGEQPFAMNVRPRIDVQVRKNPILGLGLEETTVVVECVQAHGALLELPDDTPVIIACSGGQDRNADALRVSSQRAQGEFRVRSVGLGEIKVVASARTATEELVGSATVQTSLPIAQLIAVLAGGALGGFARRFMKGARKAKTPIHVLEGLVVSLIAFVAGVLGVGYLQLPSAIVATVAGAFLTGALTGFAGVMVIEQMTSKSRRSEG